MALQICRAYSACWDAVPIPVNITEPWWLCTLTECWKSVLQKREACIGTRQNNGFGLHPTSSCKARVFVYTKTLLARQLRCSRMVPRSTACCECERLLNCKMIFRLLYWAYQNLFGRLPQWAHRQCWSGTDLAAFTAKLMQNTYCSKWPANMSCRA